MHNIEEINKQANYCLNCKNKPCSNGCPINTSIPEFINQIKQHNMKEAYNILQENNILSSICSRICYQAEQCQGHCVRGIKGEPVQIGELEKFVNDWAKENGYTYNDERERLNNLYKNNTTKIAVIGSGPAGLACSRELNRNGYQVTVFEKEKELGGILRYGIPDFRLPKYLIDDITNKLKNEGIEFKTEIEFGIDVNIDSLKKSGYEAIFIAAGSRNSHTYKLAEEDCERIYSSKYFLKRYNEKSNKINDLGVTVVVGGGNVAIDCARTAIRMGAKKSYILYRRNRESMPVSKDELEECIREGVELIYLTKIKTFNEKDRTIECNKIKLEDGKVIDVPNSDFTMKADNVVFAIGLYPDEKLLNSMKLETENKLLVTDENGMTNIDGVFAGGDIMQKKATVVKAISSGKIAAKGIMNWRNKIG